MIIFCGVNTNCDFGRSIKWGVNNTKAVWFDLDFLNFLLAFLMYLNMLKGRKATNTYGRLQTQFPEVFHVNVYQLASCCKTRYWSQFDELTSTFGNMWIKIRELVILVKISACSVQITILDKPNLEKLLRWMTKDFSWLMSRQKRVKILQEDFFKPHSCRRWDERWNKCIIMQDRYVEKLS